VDLGSEVEQTDQMIFGILGKSGVGDNAVVNVLEIHPPESGVGKVDFPECRVGKIEAVEKAKELALKKGAKRAIDLEVSGAFHSSLMKEAALEFKAFLRGFNLKSGSIPVVSNVTAEPRYEAGEIGEDLFKQIYSPVLWEDSVRFMAKKGVKTFYEIGPGNVLKGLLRKINPDLEVRNVGTVEDINRLE